ncbi:hypothetical protein [Streptomyces sp. NPDC002324]
MSNSTETTAQAPAPQGTHQYLLTLQVPMGGGLSTGCWTGTWTPPEGTTRHDVYQALRSDITSKNPEYRDASVLFFDVQPNQL